MRYDKPVLVLIFAVLVSAMALFAALAGSAIGAVDPVRPCSALLGPKSSTSCQTRPTERPKSRLAASC